MLKLLHRSLVTTTALMATPPAQASSEPARPHADVESIAVTKEITLRRIVVRNAQAEGTVLFLHGFPETSYVWKNIAVTLGVNYEVHAFDWPGYGQSSRPAPEDFDYSPLEYADLLKAYIETCGIDRSKLTIYATDIGALPVLLLAIKEPNVARRIIVGDFAPFNRPLYMYDSLESLKSEPAASKTRAHMNSMSQEILENAHRRGLDEDRQFDLADDVKQDMVAGWNNSNLTSADAFFHYYAKFRRDEDFFEAHLDELTTPVKVVWGEDDLYISKEMGAELASRIDASFDVLPGIGHYPHLQNPERIVEEVRASFR